MTRRKLVYRVHALQRMFERRITEEDVQQVIAAQDVIERYDDDAPYPSKLLTGTVNGRTIHVVVAENDIAQETIVITVYEPDPARWDETFRLRRTT